MTGVKHENQFLFSMGVPISGAKVMHRASSNPQPIVVEKLPGKYVTPSQSLNGSITHVVQHEHLGAFGGSGNPFCPRDTMNQAVILAQLDMKKKKRDPCTLVEDEDLEEVPKPVKTKQRSQVKVHEVSRRPQKNASVQISHAPSRRKSPEPTPISQLPVTTNSPPTHDNEPSSQEIQRLQGDISKQLTELRDLLDNLVKECNNPKLAPSEEEEEAMDTSQEQGALRALTRQVYIVQQQVSDVERKLNAMHNYKAAARVHANKLGWTKSRLTSAYRGAYKTLLGLTNHLRRFASPFADPVFELRLARLLFQLLQSIRKLLDLYLQLTSLFSKNFHSACPELLELVDITDALQAEWQTQLEHKLKRFMLNGVQGSISPCSSKKNSTNKPSQKNIRRQISLEVTPERKSILRKSSEPSNPSRAVRKTTKKVPTTKKPTKSVLFPTHIQVHRRPHEAFSNEYTYAQPTLSSLMKSQSELKPDEKSEPLEELQQHPPIMAENKEPRQFEVPGFGGVDLVSHPGKKMQKVGESIIEELLSLESRQQERQEAKCSSTTVNDTQESKNQQWKSMAESQLTEEELRSIDLNLPPLEVLLHRLQEMENEQIQIRSRWASLKYHDTEAAAEECIKAKDSAPTVHHQHHPPSPIFFSKKSNTKQTFEIFQEQPQKFSSGELPGAIRFTKTTSRKTCRQIEESEQEVDEIENKRIPFDHQQKQKTTNQNYQGRKPKRLFLSNKILKNITENRERFSNYLLNSAYHQVESFDPWHLTEELADSILEDCIQEVSEEMQDLSHDLVHHLFNNEFIQLPALSSTQGPSEKPSMPPS